MTIEPQIAQDEKFNRLEIWGVKADTHWARFGNTARFLIVQKQINRSTIENVRRYEK